MRFRNTVTFLIIVLFLSSCNTSKKIVYFQDLSQGERELQAMASNEITIRPEDKISIIINSKDPQLTNLFNLPIVTHRIGQSLTASMNQSQQISGYTVDSEGNIDFPVLGSIHVAGMRREEIASYIKNELISKNLVKDPVVTIEFMNLAVTVMGEVNKPGRISIDRNKITLLEALGMAGDLTIYGNRGKVLVMREDSGIQRLYEVNLLSGSDLYSSPVYYLQQNDVVYVEPNATRARQSTVNGNNVLSASFWLSVGSLLTTILVLFVK